VRSYDEQVAAKIVALVRGKQLVIENETERNVIKVEGMNRRMSVPLLRQFVLLILKKLVWFNREKRQMPRTYVGRTIAEKGGLSLKQLVLGKDKFVFLVGEPGIGKSTELTNLENQLRFDETLHNLRLITRIDLNQIQTQLSEMTNCSNLMNFFKAAAPYIPVQVLENRGLGLYII